MGEINKMQEIEYSHPRLIELYKASNDYKDFANKEEAVKYAEMQEQQGKKATLMKIFKTWNVFLK
jgi:hypothetical protein